MAFGALVALSASLFILSIPYQVPVTVAQINDTFKPSITTVGKVQLGPSDPVDIPPIKVKNSALPTGVEPSITSYAIEETVDGPVVVLTGYNLVAGTLSNLEIGRASCRERVSSPV
mgnify:CR=1 FL=1